MELFSYSRLSRYESCPASFYACYIEGIKEDPTEPLVLGKAVHAVIEAAMRFNRDDEEFFRVMSKIMADTAPVEINPEEIFKLACRDVVLQELHPENNIETHFVAPLSGEPFSPEIQGYIDLWRNGDYIQLIDWKTNRVTYSPKDNHQLGLYAWYLYQQTKKPVRGKLVFLRTGETPEHEYTLGEMEEARKWAFNLALDIQDRLHKVEEGTGSPKELFPPAPGEVCQYCGYASACTDSGPLSNPEIEDYQSAQRLAREIIKLESTLSQMKDSLKKYVEACGPVELDKKKFIMQSSYYWKWDAASLKKAMRKMLEDGKDPFEHFNLTSTQLKKLGWEDEEILQLGAERRERRPALKLVSRDQK